MKLSIITINYNNKNGLQKTIDSVITQTFKDFEWIIIDGGSTDGSKELIEQYSQYITYWLSELDNGIYHAMNKGIQVAKGEYLYFLNSGDFLVSANTINQIFKKEIKEDIINGNLICYPINRRDYGIHSNNVTCFDLIKGNLNHQSTFIKKKLFDTYGYYDQSLKIAADWKFFFITLILHQCSIRYINIDIAYFDTFGISSKSLELTRKEREETLTQFLPKSILNDYKFYFRLYEIRKYKLSALLFSFIYRLTSLYEKIVFRNQ